MKHPTKGIIAAGHADTARAGAEVLKAGGNAFDAAIAAMLCAFVCESSTITAGGGGFMLAHAAERDQNILFDFFVQTPHHKRPETELDFYPVTADFGGNTQEFHVGLGAVGIPGNIAGAFHIHQKLGKMPFRTLAQPAIALAQSGTLLNDFQCVLTQLLAPIILASDEGKQIFAQTDGTLKTPGQPVYIPHLADTLDYIAREGQRAFYEGEIGQELIKDCAEKGGYLTQNDLLQYRVIERNPLQVGYRKNTVFTNPLFSSGGTLIAFSLELLAQLNFQNTLFGTEKHIQKVAQAMYLTNLARRDYFDANKYNPNMLAHFLSANYIHRFAETLRRSVGSTTHISVADRWGNAAALTTSSGEGNTYYIPKTGIMCNNMLGEEDLNPGGFHRWPTDTRLSSMMSPTMLFDPQHRLKAIMGSSGANRIRAAVLQTLINLIDFNLPIEEAVNNPRLHVEGRQLNIEHGFAEEVTHALSLPNDWDKIVWQKRSMYFGGVNAVAVLPTGEYVAAADNRRSGAVVVV